VRTAGSYLPCPAVPQSPPIDLLAFDLFDSTLVYGAVPGALMRRSAATGWSAIPVPGCLVTSIAPSPVLPGHALAGLQSGSSTSSCSLLLETTDAGQTFVPVPSPLPPGSDATAKGLAFDPADPNVRYVAVVVYSSPGGPTGQLVFQTSDGGRSWRSLDWDADRPVQQLAVAGDGRILYTVSDRRIFARELRPTRGEPRTLPFRP